MSGIQFFTRSFNNVADINIDEYQNNNTSGKNNKSKNNKFYQFLSKFADVKNKEKKILLKNEEFKYLINIIQSQLCGKNSTLIIYYKSQGNKINILKTKVFISLSLKMKK